MFSRYGFSHACFHVVIFPAAREMLKFIEPMLRLHISGLASSGAASRSASDMPSPPPVVMFSTASVDCLIVGRKRMNTAGSGVGSPVSGLRACRWMIAAPASAASMLACAICSGVIGSASDMLGVWIAPVMAQLMITLSAMPAAPLFPRSCTRPASSTRGGDQVWRTGVARPRLIAYGPAVRPRSSAG